MANVIKEITLTEDDIKKMISEKYKISPEMDLIYDEITDLQYQQLSFNQYLQKEVVIGFQLIVRGKEIC